MLGYDFVLMVVQPNVPRCSYVSLYWRDVKGSQYIGIVRIHTYASKYVRKHTTPRNYAPSKGHTICFRQFLKTPTIFPKNIHLLNVVKYMTSFLGGRIATFKMTVCHSLTARAIFEYPFII